MANVSIIVVNYNGQELIVDCLKALEAQKFQDFEVILVDNGSSDQSLDRIKKFTEQTSTATPIRVIQLEKNVGFAAGNVEGLKRAQGEYIALLNNDTEPDDMWVAELASAMRDHPEVGICASKMIVHGANVLDSAGLMYSTLLKGYNRGEGESGSKYTEPEYVFGASGGAALCRRKMIDEIGFLDEDFFLIHEDVDLSFRAQLAGWKVLYVPTARVYHKVRSSIGTMSDTAVYYTLRNADFVKVKNIPLALLLRCLPGFFIGLMTEFIYFAIKHGRLRVYLRAKLDALRMLPSMLKKRALIMRNKKVSNSYLYGIFVSVLHKPFLEMKIKKFIYH